jgi:hypothetical protein
VGETERRGYNHGTTWRRDFSDDSEAKARTSEEGRQRRIQKEVTAERNAAKWLPSRGPVRTSDAYPRGPLEMDRGAACAELRLLI